MIRTPVQPDFSAFPAQFWPYLQDTAVFDSSCSPNARVWFLDKGPGFYLKKAPRGTLFKEAAMTRFFHEKGLAPQVLAYESLDADWLLTRRVPGEDCTHALYLADPKRLCDTAAQLLRMLHDTDFSGCPVQRMEDYLATARQNYGSGVWDLSLLPESWGFATAEEAWQEVQCNGAALASDVLLHGDYCLPNIVLRDWQFSGFIDLDAGGIGDRHVDLFWGIWSLQFNLKTDAYRERFLDAYGRDRVNADALRTVAACEVFG